MLWNKKLPEWKAKGTEPPEELKEEGFTAGYKPPAPYFNWLFNAIYESVQEIRNALKEVAVTSKAADLQEDEEHRLVTDTEKTAWNGKANSDHTHPAATAKASGLMSETDKAKLDGVAEKANNYSHPSSAGNKHIPAGGSSGQILRWSADGTAAWGNDNNTTYSNMTAASANAAGKAGLVPAPAAGAQGKYLRGDGTWQTPPDTNTTYSAATQSAAGLMSAADKKKLDGVAEKANNYSHPTTAGNKHIPAGGSSGQILRWSADGTAAWGSDNNTTYSAATQSAAGLMSAADKKKLDGVASGANVTPSGLMSGYVQSGKKAGTTVGEKSTIEGGNNTASGGYSHAEGNGTTASGDFSHAEGSYTTTKKSDSHAEGYYTIASAVAQHVIGGYNVEYAQSSDGWGGATSNVAFIIGNGTSSARSNAFRVTFDGKAYGKSAYNTSGADYAEYFEWLDGNPEDEDRRGYFVTMDGDKIRIANSEDDYILGVISGKPSVVGNSDPDDWHGHFLCDEFGDFIIEKVIEKRKEHHVEEVEETYLDEDGTEKVRLVPKMFEDEVEVEVDSYVLNPDYDPDKPYVPRAERKEWAAVGMLGVLLVRDDRTCQINGYCKVADGGIATANETGWRVIARVNEHLVKIVFR